MTGQYISISVEGKNNCENSVGEEKRTEGKFSEEENDFNYESLLTPRNPR